MKKKYDCGIDLGTTNSCVALSVDGVNAEVIESTTDNLSTTPSAVYISKSGKMMIGQSAYQQADRKNVALQFKRLMGTSEKKVFKSSGEERTPEELSAEILKKLRQDYKARTGEDAMDVIITIPAAFTSVQNEATQKAARLAGFRNALLLQEPIAASIAYGVKPDATDKYWMVFDYGGGTLDVAIVSTLNGRLKVINTEGDNFFGGCDLDAELLDKIVLPKLREEYSIGKPIRAELKNRLLLEIENMKKSMGSNESAPLLISGIYDDEQEEIEFDYDVSKEEFEAAISEIVDDSIEIAKNALEGSKIKAEQLEKILLVGGSTYVELVRRRLKETFGKEIDTTVNPMHAVAIGASIFAANNYADIVEEDAVAEHEDDIVCKCTYMPQTDKDKTTLMCQFANLPEADYYVEVRNPFWSTGYMKLDATGTCKMQINLVNDDLNSFDVILYDGFKQECAFAGDRRVDVVKKKQAIKISGAPMAHSISIGVMSGDYMKLDVVLAKNTILPAANTVTYVLGKNIYVGTDDEISFRVYEGENTDNPLANAVAGEIHISGKSILQNVHKDTEVELKISIDENRIIHVWGRFLETGESIPETVLFEKEQIDIEDRFFELEYLIPNMKVSIRNIGRVNPELMEMYDRELQKVIEGYHSFEEHLDSGKEIDFNLIYKYIERFYEFQTKVIRAERNRNQQADREEIESRLRDVEEMLNDFGTAEGKENFKRLQSRIMSASNAEIAGETLNTLERQSRQDCSGNIEYHYRRFVNLRHYAANHNLTWDATYKMWEDKGMEAYQKNDGAALQIAADGLNQYLSQQINQEGITKEILAFNKIRSHSGIDMNDSKIKMLMAQGNQAMAQGDAAALKTINEHLRKLCVDSANQLTEKIKSDLHMV